MPNTMKSPYKLGVLGGMGPEATSQFYARVIARTQAKSDQEHLPCVVLSDCTLPDRTAALQSGDTTQLLARLQSDAQILEQLGCVAIAIPCNTSHSLLPEIQGAVHIPVVNMVEETVKRLPKGGTFALLATEGTVSAGLYQAAAERHGITLVAPPQEVQQAVNAIIYEVVKAGHVGEAKDFFPIANAMRALKCHGLVLACTELSVFCRNHRFTDCIDAMECLTEASILACGYPLREEEAV